MPRLTAAKRAELTKRFQEYDRSGDGKLNFQEMQALLRKGNPNLGDAEVRKLYDKVDRNRDGNVDFDEFVAYLYDAGKPVVLAPEACKTKFTEFCGDEMDGREFAKFCADCQLLCQGFRKQDVDMTFAKVVPRGKRKISLAPGADGVSQYDKLLCLVAEKKGCTPADVHSLVASGEKTSSATRADSVRFHDDKSLYTGAHAANSAHGDTSKAPRHVDKFDVGPEGEWGQVEIVFLQFAKEDGGLDSREFAKLCDDSGLVDKEFAKGDADVIFATLRAKKIDFERFKQALKLVAERKEMPIKTIQATVASCSGPRLRATRTGSVRLHDDPSTYTGIHVGK